MYWADKIAENIVSTGSHKPYWVDDMKTPSGFSHVGSMLGPVLHSIVFRALKDRGQDATFTFVINDFDPVDGLPSEMMEEYGKYMGYPLKLAPSPSPEYENMADYFAHDFIESFRYLGVEAKTVSSWEMYQSGKFDGVIKLALDNAERIQDIYREVSGSQKKEKGWLPFQVICESCGKLGTTRVHSWDGKKVTYTCEPKMVTWAEGCGHEGGVSPFGGTGKLPWKVDWAAHWKVLGVTIEGAGKDHASAGGSYDIAMAIVSEIFHYDKPFKIPYEWILFGGRKMSTSKGVGMKAHDLVSILPAEVARFLFARHNYRKQTNFNAEGTDEIPDLFDEYDRGWDDYNKGKESDLARTFVLSQIKEVPGRVSSLFIPRFREVANYLQLPNVELQDKMKELKGEPLTEFENSVLKERAKYAKIWLAKYAPKEARFALSEGGEGVDLSQKEKEYLKEVVVLLEHEHDAETLQGKLYEATKKIKIPAGEAFSALYRVLIGKTHGPRAAWFLLSYPQADIVKRLKDAAK